MDLRALAQAIWAARDAVGIGSPEDFKVPSLGLIDQSGIYPSRDAYKPFDKMIADWTK